MVTCAVSEIETGVLVFFLALRTEEEMLAELEEIWKDTITMVRRRLAAGDEQMKREYIERH